ncbi:MULTISPECIES: saccharopine dehydrogenase family protein [unclassified Marinovum]
MTIHWCGTGLSAVPGLRRLLQAGHALTVWNRTLDKAQDAVGDLTNQIKRFDIKALTAEVQPEDVIVSMLPANWHVPLATLAITKGAHFVSSSYISPEMRALHAKAQIRGVSLVNEVGLDPGIDHLMAHALVSDYRTSPRCEASNALGFTSYCGGIPKHATPFRYKFSWSPLGVLKALKTPSKALHDFREVTAARPWDALSTYTAPLPHPESFEVYPNRDSVPFIEEYHFDPTWRVETFVRGTLRPNGWAEAWKPVFDAVETADEAELKQMSDSLWNDHAYSKDEPDRVVLCVSLSASNSTGTVWHKTHVLDAWGDARGTAMARLVSIPVALAVEAAQAGKLPAGVQAAPSDPSMVTQWMAEISKLAQHLAVVDHT